MIQFANAFNAFSRDLRGETTPILGLKDHLDATMAWLCRAQDVSGDGGVAAGYTLHRGWTPSYPETTGYIIPTFLDYADLTSDERYRERARRMGAWESDIQLADGGVRGRTQTTPVVFDTGQVIFGWVDLFRRFNDTRSLDSARKAGDWLIRHQDADGKWTAFEFKNVPHVYNTRVTWSLLLLADASGDNRYREAAIRNLEWVLAQEVQRGWFKYMSFTSGAEPFTHTIAYTLEGLMECAALVDEPLRARCLAPVFRATDALIAKYRLDQPGDTLTLPGTLDADWNSSQRYVCLTGNAQFAMIWQTLYAQTGNPAYLAAAERVLRVVMARHAVQHPSPAIAGAVAGSSPCWGGYLGFWYPNWAAKFFADALMRHLRVSAHAPR